jgi:hypothetical protein
MDSLNLDQRKEDTQYLLGKLEEIHKNPYKNIKRAELEKSFNEACNKDPKHFKYALQETLALLGDAHTLVAGLKETTFPINYMFIDRKLYIVGLDKKHKNFLGKEVISFEDTPVSRLEKSLLKLSSKENQERIFRDTANFLQSKEILNYVGLAVEDTVDIVTKTGTLKLGTTSPENFISLNPIVWKKEDYVHNPTYQGNDIYRFRFDCNTLIFQYNSCTNRGYTSEQLVRFQKKLLSATREAKNIVVDLRINGGGNTAIMSKTLENFTKDVQIYVAIGRRTYSSAIHHALYLKREKGATLIGENAGQPPNRFGDRKEITLPNSGIEIHCSYKYFELLPGQDVDTIKPDISVPITIEDYMHEHDPLNKWIGENLEK